MVDGIFKFCQQIPLFPSVLLFKHQNGDQKTNQYFPQKSIFLAQFCNRDHSS
uniref:Putative lactoylglutathione lyase isoform X2 n=1 Tax=Rhizophora mucronata TaxID=61149 RepID=A0A2P2JSD0_RHIMU